MLSWLQSLHIPQQIFYEEIFDRPHNPNRNIECGKAEIYVLAANIPATRRASNFIKNSLSAVIMIRYGQFEAILTGDETFDTEDVIISRYPAEWLRVDLLKIGHHGSKSTSTSMKWVAVVQPEVAVVSAGPNNSHGHPSAEVVKRLEPYTKAWKPHPMTYAEGVRNNYSWITTKMYKEAVFSTANSGTIVITSDGLSYDIALVPFRE
jgi:beta-lactamase superfamily II metal-dependent hydrolase